MYAVQQPNGVLSRPNRLVFVSCVLGRWCQSVLDGWVMAESLTRWAQLWVANMCRRESGVSGSRLLSIWVMKQFTNNWQLSGCQCTGARSHVSPTQNNTSYNMHTALLRLVFGVFKLRLLIWFVLYSSVHEHYCGTDDRLHFMENRCPTSTGNNLCLFNCRRRIQMYVWKAFDTTFTLNVIIVCVVSGGLIWEDSLKKTWFDRFVIYTS